MNRKLWLNGLFIIAGLMMAVGYGLLFLMERDLFRLFLAVVGIGWVIVGTVVIRRELTARRSIKQ
jgi:hypothetical protein